MSKPTADKYKPTADKYWVISEGRFPGFQSFVHYESLAEAVEDAKRYANDEHRRYVLETVDCYERSTSPGVQVKLTLPVKREAKGG